MYGVLNRYKEKLNSGSEKNKFVGSCIGFTLSEK